MTGVYVGDEQQFRGRRALLKVDGDVVSAQFHQGEVWETHSWLIFHLCEWLIDANTTGDRQAA